MDTLEVHGFEPTRWVLPSGNCPPSEAYVARRVVAHPRVLQWMNQMTGVDTRTQEEIDDDREYWDEFEYQ